MRAFTHLQEIIREPARKALLRRELTGRGYANWQVDHALAKARKAGLITRVGQGIYAVGDARIAEVMPEVLPKLGYQVLPPERLRNYSIRRSGVTYRLDRPCRRFVMRNGVVATFQTPQGRLCEINFGKTTQMNKPPTVSEVDQHYRTFQYCHSPARAEKDLIVSRVLDVYDDHSDETVKLAIEGGTSLGQYQGLISRFSEDLDIRVVFHGEQTNDERREAMRGVGGRLAARLQDELPFLKLTNKGRLRRDGVVHTLIFDYLGHVEHDEVTPGIKVALVATSHEMPVVQASRKHHNCLVIDPIEIYVGKVTALAERLPRGGDSNPDLVRHVHDIAAGETIITAQKHVLTPLLRTISDELPAVVDELCGSSWRHHYDDYMRRMGSLPTFEGAREQVPRTHLAWSSVLHRFTGICRRLDAIGDETVDQVSNVVASMVPGEFTQSGRTRA